jgi:hypothetical protein
MPTRALFTASNAEYLPGVVALLGSVARHHPDIPRYCMVMPETRAAACDAIGNLAEVLTPPRAIAGVPAAMQMCVLRLFAPLLPADVVAYIDADAILCAPAPELWEVSGGKVRACATGPRTVLNSMPTRYKLGFLRLFTHVEDRRCFNSGVFSFETAPWRDLPERFESAIARCGFDKHYHPILDQPVLHGLFGDSFDWLPVQFNVGNLFDTRIPRDTRILHFTGGKCKPWSSHYPRHEPQWLWWLKHGLGETDPARLAAARFHIALHTPRRELARYLRRRREI